MHQIVLKSIRMRVSSRLPIGLTAWFLAIAPVFGTTLEQLTLADMARQSTSIVRARVTGSHSAYKGSEIYTYFQLQVLETWKSAPQTTSRAATEVAIPGGAVNGIQQSVTGAPDLKTGEEYVLFLWTSRSGLTQVIGLSQGRFSVLGDRVQRPPSSELILDRSGRPVEDRAMSLSIQDLRAQVLQSLHQTAGGAK